MQYYMKQKQETILQEFNIVEKTIQFCENGLFSFNDLSFKAFKNFNKYLEKSEQLTIELLESVDFFALQVFGCGQEYAFKITKKEIQEFSEHEKIENFCKNLVKKYAKYFNSESKKSLHISQFENKLLIYNSIQILELHDPLFEKDFFQLYGSLIQDNTLSENQGYQRHNNISKNIIGADYTKYFEIPKYIDYGILTIDIENSQISNQEEKQKAKIKSSENFTFSKDVSLGEKSFNLFCGKKVYVNQDNVKMNYLKAEHKDFNVYCVTTK